MQRGYTLVELIVVLAIIGLLCSITLPNVVWIYDQLAVDGAAGAIAGAHRRARVSAVLLNRAMVLTISADSITIRPRNDTTALWRALGPAARGVTLAGRTRTVMFSPIGLAMGASNATFSLTRGDARRAVIVSRLGRVRMAP